MCAVLAPRKGAFADNSAGRVVTSCDAQTHQPARFITQSAPLSQIQSAFRGATNVPDPSIGEGHQLGEIRVLHEV